MKKVMGVLFLFLAVVCSLLDLHHFNIVVTACGIICLVYGIYKMKNSNSKNKGNGRSNGKQKKTDNRTKKAGSDKWSR